MSIYTNVILKLNFEKAFDTIEHNTILAILQQIGFSSQWCNWFRRLFDSGSSSIRLNGVPGKEFQCKRRVRQGNPLSPLHFVIAADLLQHIINKADNQGLLRPIPEIASNDFPIIEYADETILIMKASKSELLRLKEILEEFARSTGLKVNFHKSYLVPLNTTPEKTNGLASGFGC